MTKRATMQDVADAAGVSIATVDRILNRRAPVKRATMELVLMAAQRVGYHGMPSLRDRMMANAPPATFGFLLNQSDRALYSEFAQLLAQRTRDSRIVRGRAVLRHLESLSSEETVRGIEELAAECNAIAIVALDTPAVNEAVEHVVRAGTPVFAMLSDIATPLRSGFIGSDAWKIGRGAGWMVERLSRPEGAVGLLLGSTDYAAHRGYAAGFRSYLADRGSRLSIIDAGETLESDKTAAELTRALIARQPDLTTVMVAGGGLGGVADAIRAADLEIVVVGTELSRQIDDALSDRIIDAVLSHPIPAVVEATVASMELVLTSGASRLPDPVPVEIRISETV